MSEQTTFKYHTPPCMVCGEASEIIVQLSDLRRWCNGELIQKVWPDWTPDQRELLMTGTHPLCWNEMFPLDDYEDEYE